MSSNTGRLKYLFKNTIIFTLGNIGTKLVSFFLVPLYTNYLLVEEYGTVDLVITLASFIVPILIFNINEAIMRFSLDKNADRDAIMSTGILSIFFLTATSISLVPLVQLYKPLAGYGMHVFLYFFSTGLSTVLTYNLRGQEKLLHFSIGSIINAFFTAIFNIIFLVAFDLGISGFLLAYILGNLITAIYAFFAGNVFGTMKRFRFDKELTVAMVKYSVVLIPNSFMWWIMNASNRVILTSMVGIASAGLYAVANKLPSIISVVSSIFNQAWNYSAIREDDTADRESFNNRAFDYLFGFVCFAGSALLVVLKPILSVYVDEAYFSSWSFTPPLILGSCILVLATFLSSQYTVNKDSKGFLFSATAGAVANIVLNFALIPFFAELGSAIATCISYLVVFIYRIIDIRKYINMKVVTVKHILTFACLFISAISVYIDIYGYIIGGIAVASILLLYANTLSSVISFFLKRKK